MKKLLILIGIHLSLPLHALSLENTLSMLHESLASLDQKLASRVIKTGDQGGLLTAIQTGVTLKKISAAGKGIETEIQALSQEKKDWLQSFSVQGKISFGSPLEVAQIIKRINGNQPLAVITFNDALKKEVKRRLSIQEERDSDEPETPKSKQETALKPEFLQEIRRTFEEILNRIKNKEKQEQTVHELAGYIKLHHIAPQEFKEQVTLVATTFKPFLQNLSTPQKQDKEAIKLAQYVIDKGITVDTLQQKIALAKETFEGSLKLIPSNMQEQQALEIAQYLIRTQSNPKDKTVKSFIFTTYIQPHQAGLSPLGGIFSNMADKIPTPKQQPQKPSDEDWETT